MSRWVRNGLILMATLALLIQGESKLFPPPVGKIPDGVIESRKATSEEKVSNRKLAKDYASAGFGWSGAEWKCLESLWTGESRFDQYAQARTSSARGIAQLLGEESNDPALQILRGLKYISKRHHTPCRAYKFWRTSTPHHY
jgi:hypothetical protein